VASRVFCRFFSALSLYRLMAMRALCFKFDPMIASKKWARECGIPLYSSPWD
jgi:hypothetical protein